MQTLIDNAGDLDIKMVMHNLLEYTKSYSKISGSLLNYCRDEPKGFMVGNINNSKINSKSFDYKRSITGRLEGSDTNENVDILLKLKYLSNFWRTLDISLINCKVYLTLTWSASCVKSWFWCWSCSSWN